MEDTGSKYDGRKRKLVRQLKKKRRHAPPGTAPGSLNVPEGALKPLIRIFSYDAGFFEEKVVADVNAIKSQLDNNPERIHWIDIKGLGDREFFVRLAD